MSIQPTHQQLLDTLGAQSMPAAGRLLRKISHDLKTPISTIAMEIYSVRMLVKTLAGDPGGEVQLEEVCANIETAIGQLVDYATALGKLVPHRGAEAGVVTLAETQKTTP